MKLIALGMLLAFATAAYGKLVTRTVEYRDGDVSLRGYLAYDDKVQGRRPAVLVVPEWWGLNDYARHRVEMVAGLGYVGFGIDMYGGGITTDDPQKAGELANKLRGDLPALRNRARAAYEEVRRLDVADPNRVAIMGYCFGGTTALQLAFDGTPVAVAVSFHGNLIPPTPEDIARTRARLLILHGGSDPLVTPEQVAKFQDALRPTSLDWELVVFGGAKHSFTNPGSDKRGIPGLAYNARADARSWELMKLAFQDAFARK